jgi:hypothetical protein
VDPIGLHPPIYQLLTIIPLFPRKLDTQIPVRRKLYLRNITLRATFNNKFGFKQKGISDLAQMRFSSYPSS